MNNKGEHLILWFDQLSIEDVPVVGGKNAALGEMYSRLTPMGVKVPNGFALTSKAYERFLKHNNLRAKIDAVLKGVNTSDVRDLQKRGKAARELILSGSFPDDLKRAIEEAYRHLGLAYFENPDVAVRSSATAEDLPGASFAGQQETYLNVQGTEELSEAVKKCMASLFTDRAISYRHDKGFDHFKIALSVGVQKMVRSDVGASGVAFTIDTETGLDKVVVVNGTYGLGELIVQGQVIPDEWLVFKPSLDKGLPGIISRTLGQKKEKMVYASKGIKRVKVSAEDAKRYALTDAEVHMLASWCKRIEEYFSAKHNRYQPMDIEWAKDGKTGELFIVQARPETVQAEKDKNVWEEYVLSRKGEKTLLEGISVGTKIAWGKARVIKDASQIHEFQKGEILVTEMTDPDWEPIMKIAAGIITDKGSRTSHAAIVSRELGIACIVGTERATKTLKTGEPVTIDCSGGAKGVVYAGAIPFRVVRHDLARVPSLPVTVMVNVGSAEDAMKNHYLPVKGVGLAREEFIIASEIKVHPNALIHFDELKKEAQHDKKTKAVVKQIEELTFGYAEKKEYYVDMLAQGIAKIAAAFWPHQVIVRFSDFKTNEYRNLIGGERYEPHEENPMIGWRGASRYYDPKFKDAFALEVKAMRRARDEFGLVNIVPMVPFVRTVKEAVQVVRVMEEAGLKRDREHIRSCTKPVEECSHVRIYMMCEVPSNVLLADSFLDLFDGYSIGSNDLTQLALGLDRDSGIVAHIGNENDEAVKRLVAEAIRVAKKHGKYIGICGQAPSDIDGYAVFLMKEGIDSISLNPDVVIKTMMKLA